MKKFWKSFCAAISVILLLGGIFMITSLSLASIHDNSLVDEWESWGSYLEEQVEDDNNVEETPEIENYSNIEIIV